MSDIPSTKPYLIRALYDWCVDSGYTPYIAVVVDDQVRVPRGFVKDGQIVLNVAPHATHQFTLDNEAMSCQARFGGQAQQLYVPIGNIAAIYARENGQGMAFEVEVAAAGDGANEGDDTVSTPPVSDESAKPEPDPEGGRPKLRVVK